MGTMDLQGEVTELRSRLKSTELDLASQQEKATHALRALRDEITKLQQERSGLREALYNTKATAPMEMMRQRLQELRSEEHTSELQSLMRSSYAVFCLKKKTRR